MMLFGAFLFAPLWGAQAIAQDAPGAAATQPAGDAGMVVCPSQQDLEQVLGSDGKFRPDGCRRLTITPVRSQNRELCVLRFRASGEQGLLDQLRDVAARSEWWTVCADLRR